MIVYDGTRPAYERILGPANDVRKSPNPQVPTVGAIKTVRASKR